ncbi:CRISPR system precrRNA processing endoribonuclease RAMP protein Cas6 [Selenomonas sputigena]|uniref:CRISPR system precrRNA processing endoribonuclease RAMP protein Cas6 n=1 Tax=Selenomonas sputigena TaxID=69823 RepID=A0ABV3X8Q3_9FIRM
MIGAVVYELRAERGAQLPFFHGRWMHGLFFKILEAYSPSLAEDIHEKTNIKPFTVSLLKRETKREYGKASDVHEGERMRWRITGMQEEVLRAAFHVREGGLLQAGTLPLRVEHVVADGTKESGILDEMELVARVLSVRHIQEIQMRFLSPVSFRRDDRDYPSPDPVFIFSSLVDKWQQLEMPVEMDKDWVRAAAAEILPGEWQGAARRVYFARDRGMLAFSGKYNFDVTRLSEEQRQVALLLAQFATFSGVGRLTGQGFGETRICYR